MNMKLLLLFAMTIMCYAQTKIESDNNFETSESSMSEEGIDKTDLIITISCIIFLVAVMALLVIILLIVALVKRVKQGKKESSYTTKLGNDEEF